MDAHPMLANGLHTAPPPAVTREPEAITVEGDAHACLHCGGALAARDRDGFCCVGCRVVHGLLHAQGLSRYYDLRGGAASPAVAAKPGRDLKWLEPIEARLAQCEGADRVELDLQGIQCAACVWLQEELFQRRGEGALDIVVNPAIGRVELQVTRDFPLRAWIEDVERFGYLFGPAIKREAPRSSALLGRIGVCVALAMNAMMFSIPLYIGLREGAVYVAFRWMGLILATASVIVGGWVFIRSAWEALRRGILHLDVPIALGVILAWVGSVWNFSQARDNGSFFDTLATFIALMLVGRWLQERVIERNRMMLLASDGVDDLLARRVTGERVEVVPCRDLHAGDSVLVAPGDLIPVRAKLTDASASCSLDWINGESAPRAFSRGDSVPAGAFNLGVAAITLTAEEDFVNSGLPGLLRTTRDHAADTARSTRWWQRITRGYVLSVLVVSVASFAWWALYRHDFHGALQATTAILVVTCPCAFGLATPMAYELILAGLRRAGLFVRSSSLLDRLPAVRRVVFDKTGTLTTGVLELRDPRALDALSGEDREALYNIAVRSTHPRSVAVRRALESSASAVRYRDGWDVREETGAGVELTREGTRWRLGRRDWAAGEGDGREMVFARDDRMLAALETAEVMRPDAPDEVRALTAAGYDVWILSGDTPDRVRAMAARLGVADDHAIGGCSPEDKARWLAAHDRQDTWMIGDGINDAPAVERAFCSATPAVDRPFMPARTDCHFVTAGLGPVRLALRMARVLAAVNRRNLAVAVVYNVGTVALAFAGRMSPLLCAVVMPLTSLSILLATMATLTPGRATWRS
jgi:Cu2+-exporting ATPase